MTDVPKDQTLSGLENFTVHVTGHNESGESTFRSSSMPQWQSYMRGALGMTTIFTNEFKANLNDHEDIKKHEAKMESGKLGLINPGGTLIRMVDFAPGKEGLMHQTKSLDFGILLIGRLEAIMSSGETRIMKPGDVCVQRGTKHAFRNPSATDWARIVFVDQDIEHVVINGEKLKEDFFDMPVNFPRSGNDE